MKQDPADMTLKPFNFGQILEEVPELGKFAYRIDSFSFDPIIDSSDMEPSLWQAIASLIHEKYDDVKIGGMLAFQQIYPETSKSTDVWAAKQIQEFLNFNIYDADTGCGYSPEVLQYAKDHKVNWDITEDDKE